MANQTEIIQPKLEGRIIENQTFELIEST